MKNIILLFFVCSVQILFGQHGTESTSPTLVTNQTMVSNLMNADISFYVSLPMGYDIDAKRSFPVIYWLHGSNGWPPGILPMLAKRFQRAIKEGKIPPTIIVFLDDNRGDSMWVDSKDGSVPMERVVIQEIIPHIDQSFRTIKDAQGRILEGGSMGGYGAARFGFKYPNQFGAISMLNPGPMQEILIPSEAPLAGKAKAQKTLDNVYGGDIDYFRALSPWNLAIEHADKIRGKLAIRMILGGSDPSLANNKRFSDHLENLGIAHSTTILEDAGHSPKEMFTALGDHYWDFFKQNLPNDND